MRLGIAEILRKVSNLELKSERQEFLRKHDSVPLRIVLKCIYDPEIEFDLPEGAPPYKESEYIDDQNQLYKEARKIKIFIKGGAYPDLHPIKRETLFIRLLETVSKDDAKLLIEMKDKKKQRGITKKTLLETFPDLFERNYW